MKKPTAVAVLAGAMTVVWIACAPAAAGQPSAAAGGDPSPAAHADLLDEYCLTCHNFTQSAGGLFLELFDPAEAHLDPETAERLIMKLRAGMMPPHGEPAPSRERVEAMISEMAARVDAAAGPFHSTPGLHRLNRAEYANAVRDLLGVNVDASAFLPADDVSRGFDNQAGTLGISTALLEAYLAAAGRLSRLVLATELEPDQVVYRVPEDESQHRHVEGLPFGTRGGILIRHTFPADGDYRLRIVPIPLGNMGAFRPFGEVRGEQLLVLVNGERVALLDWDEQFEGGFGSEDVPSIRVPISVTAGEHEIGVTFLATNFAPGHDINHAFERTTIETGGLPGFTFHAHVGNVRIDGPFNGRRPQGPAPLRDAVIGCDAAAQSQERACAHSALQRLARLAYRGHVTDADVATLMAFFDEGREEGGFDLGMELALQRLLTDPKFIYRVAAEPADVAPGEVYRISDLELASRLSFFLWSSLPDDELLTLAERGRLSRPDVYRAQVQRLLDDPRSFALTQNFAGQWLALRNLDGHSPVPHAFPDFDHNLRSAFRRETELLFDSLIREDRSVVELLTADYTFLNERLAVHYGIPGVRGSHFRRVELGERFSERHGILGKGSLLTVTSQPGRTSPVMRGDWVLANVVGVPVPPPPPDVPEIEPPDHGATLTIREQYEEHRNNPACMGCHVLMDPIGFALEAYDGIGRYRHVDESGLRIDTADVMYDGTPVDGAADLRAFLVRHREQFVTTVAEKLLTYAMGRGVEYTDRPMVRAIVRAAAEDDHSLRSLVLAVAESEAFRMNMKLDDGSDAVLARE